MLSIRILNYPYNYTKFKAIDIRYQKYALRIMSKDRMITFVGTFITALAFASEVWYVELFYEHSMNIYLFLSAFIMGFGGYIYLRFTKYNQLNKMLFVLVMCFIVSAILWYSHQMYSNKKIELSIHALLCLILSGILLLMYHSKIFFHAIRNNILMKPLIIALVWMLLVYFYVQKFTWWLYFQQFEFLFLLTIPFDIKGLPTDTIITIPKVLGRHKTIRLLIVMVAIYWILGLFLPKNFIFNSTIVSLILASFVFVDSTYHKLLVYIFYDGIIVLQTLLLLVLNAVDLSYST